MRLFVGIRIPDEIKKGIEKSVVSDLKKNLREARIVASENQHLTLKFIGETSESNIPAIETIISSSVEKFPRIKAKIQGVGIFPDEKNARIFWVGIDSGGQLKKLNNILENEIEKAGISRKETRFKEHITIARFKSTPKITLLQGILEQNRDAVFGEMEIKEIELIQSHLYSSCPVYMTLFKTGVI